VKYYDKNNNRLVFFKESADYDYWDKHWKNYRLKTIKRSPPKNRFIISITKKYLPVGARILEGGCGMGDKVNSLHKAGYEVYGVDIAKEAVYSVNKFHPELKIIPANVKSLPFKDNFFHGYWSLGVIEHFYGDYDDILKEMKRVLMRGGYLFLTFPTMSLLRKIKVKMKMYPPFENNMDIKHFYQFAMDSYRVKKKFETNGFRLIKENNLSGVKGLKDEVLIIKPFLQKIFDAKNIFTKILNFSLDYMLSACSGHMKFMIFKKMLR